MSVIKTLTGRRHKGALITFIWVLWYANFIEIILFSQSLLLLNFYLGL